jgi:hypothetical protein
MYTIKDFHSLSDVFKFLCLAVNKIVTLHTILPAGVLELINENQLLLHLLRLHCAGKKNMMIDFHHFAMFNFIISFSNEFRAHHENE